MTMSRRYRYTTALQVGLGFVLIGLLLAKSGKTTHLQLVWLGFLALPMLARLRFPALFALAVIGLNLGLWRGAELYSQLYSYTYLQNQKVTLIGKVLDDAAYSDRGQLEFKIGSVRSAENDLALPGTVSIRGFDAPSVRRGDIISAEGKLREGFGARQGFMSYASIEVMARDDSWLERVRSEYFAGVYSALPDPHASLGLGFLAGTRTLLPDDLIDALAITGLTHIVAVSGYNLTILVRLTRRLFAERSLFLSMAVSVGLLVGFIFVTGLSPSIARASVVCALALTAWYFGRDIKPTVLLLSVAVITAMVNPLYLWFDLGWYLSFAAFAGVLVVAPLITQRYFKKPPKVFGQILLETTCAQLMTLPIIAFVFSEVSVISLLANLLVLPLIPLIMLCTFLAGLAGMVLPHLSGLISWPAEFLLTYTIDIIYWLARVPWAMISLRLDWYQLIWLYASLVVVALAIARRSRSSLDSATVIE